MTSVIEVKVSELTQLHNALVYANVEKVHAIAFNDVVKVEVKHKTSDQLFTVGKMLDSMPADREVDAKIKEAKAEKDSK